MPKTHRLVNHKHEQNKLFKIPQAHTLDAKAIKAQADTVKQVMEAVMEENVHFGKIPGAPKPTLFKPGSEKLLSTFRIACNPMVTDLSVEDVIHYRVEAKGIHMVTGIHMGSGIGECSSNEEKYKWRRVLCEQEWEATPEDRRRIKWAKGFKSKKIEEVKQVRTNPADLANTILKMAKKRAQVDLVLTTTAASDIFSQDIEDLPDEVRDHIQENRSKNGNSDGTRSHQPPQRKSFSNDAVINEEKGRRLRGLCSTADINQNQLKAHLTQTYGIERIEEILAKDYDAICAWIHKGGQS